MSIRVACPVVQGPGGISAYARALISAAGPDPVEVLSYGAHEPLFALPPHARLSVSTPSQAVFAARLLGHMAMADKGTYVLAHIGLARPLALRRRHSRHRVVLLLHGFEAWGRIPTARALGLDRVDLFVTTTNYTRELFLADNRRHIRSDAQFAVIPLSADPSLEKRPVAPVPTGEKRRIVCVSRLTDTEPLKGVTTLIRAMRRLDPARYELVVVGDGAGRKAYERYAQEQGVAERVRFTGWVSDEQKMALLESADVFCLPSAQEGFGIAFLEAMVLGRPCVGAMAGAVPEVLGREVGTLFPFDDDQALGAALESQAERLRSGELTPRSVRDWYDERYNFDRFAHRWQELLGR